jgi:hypothetical protein
MPRTRSLIIGGVVVLTLIAGIAYEIARTRPARGALRTCSELFTAANRPDLRPEQRIATARALCTRRYLSTHELDVAQDGQGLVGIPRNLNKNFKVWKEGADVWICPTNRVGPVYRFVLEDGAWRFDGLVGILGPMGQVVPMEDLPEGE